MIKKYLDFVLNINEGVIMTQSTEKCERIITKKLKKYNINFIFFHNDVNFFDLEIIDYKKLQKNNIIDEILVLCNNLGYFPTKIICSETGKDNFNIYTKIKYNTEKLKDIVKLYGFNTVRMCFEAKFYKILQKPIILYHLSLSKNRKSILSNGLKVKSGSKLQNTPKAVYLFNYEYNYSNLLNSLKIYYTEQKEENILFDLYQIEDFGDLDLHKDSTHQNFYFSYNPIFPQNIKLIETNL
jgi:hypothetical protein